MSFIKKKSRLPVEDGKNPYLNARRTWNSHVGSLIASRMIWQVVAVTSLMIVLASVGGLVYIGSQSRFIPYVVEVDKLGEVAAQAPLQRAGAIDPRIVREAVGNFITNARMVTPDIALQRKAVFDVYAMLNKGSAASNKMTEFLNGKPDMNPFNRAAKETVNTEILSIIPQTANTWQVDWKETVRDRKNGAVIGKPYLMRALVITGVRAGSGGASDEQMRANPLGIYVSDFAWSKQN
jgi:type IV secretion system protein TrbF